MADPLTPPADVYELDDLLNSIVARWRQMTEMARHDQTYPTPAAYLRRRLAEHGYQIIKRVTRERPPFDFTDPSD